MNSSSRSIAVASSHVTQNVVPKYGNVWSRDNDTLLLAVRRIIIDILTTFVKLSFSAALASKRNLNSELLDIAYSQHSAQFLSSSASDTFATNASPQNTAPLNSSPYHRQMLIDFQDSFTRRLGGQFATIGKYRAEMRTTCHVFLTQGVDVV